LPTDQIWPGSNNRSVLNKRTKRLACKWTSRKRSDELL